MITYEDATDSQDQRAHFPEYAQALQDIGFVHIGRVVLKVDQGIDDGPDPEATEAERIAHEQAQVPTSVLRSPNGEAFAEVNWFHDSPEVRLSTELADGFYVVTIRRWNAPVWDNPEIDFEKLTVSEPGESSSTRISMGALCSDVLDDHVSHVESAQAARGVPPIAHLDLVTFRRMATEEALRNFDAMYGADMRRAIVRDARGRTNTIGIAAVAIAVLLVIAAVVWRLVGGQ